MGMVLLTEIGIAENSTEDFLWSIFCFAVRTNLWWVNPRWHPSIDFWAQWGGWFGVVHFLEDIRILSSSWTPQVRDFNGTLWIYINKGGLDMHFWLSFLFCNCFSGLKNIQRYFFVTKLCWKCFNKVRNSYSALVPGICVQNKGMQF